jgi:hypothetical protein
MSVLLIAGTIGLALVWGACTWLAAVRVCVRAVVATVISTAVATMSIAWITAGTGPAILFAAVAMTTHILGRALE